MSRITLRLDTSQIVQALKCSTYHDFVSIQNLTRKHTDRSALDKGTVFHGLLQRYYQKIWERETWQTAMNYSLSQLIDLQKQVKLESNDLKLIVLRFNDYCVKYASSQIQVETLQNGRPALEIGFSIPIVDNESYYFVLEGRIDMIAIMSGVRVIWDHKAQGRDYKLYGHSYQMLNYAFAADCNRIMYNYVRLHASLQPNTFFQDLTYIPMWLMKRWKQKIVDIFFKIAASRIEGRFIDKDFPNLSCSDIGFGKICPFTKVCQESDPRVRQSILLNDYVKREPWQPWSLEESFSSNGDS